MLRDREDAYKLLVSLQAPDRLMRHLRLVGEAADLLVDFYARLGVGIDARRIELGVAVHDAGKILFVEELNGPGARHEVAGRDLMLANGVQAEVAECCVSHAAWQTDGLSLEELSVALADKLWKGKREEPLELLVIDAVAQKLGVNRWDVFLTCDTAFESIAATGPERLARS